MPIRFRCQACQARLSVSSRKAGARAKCPKCGQQLKVPIPEGYEAAVEKTQRQQKVGGQSARSASKDTSEPPATEGKSEPAAKSPASKASPAAPVSSKPSVSEQTPLPSEPKPSAEPDRRREVVAPPPEDSAAAAPEPAAAGPPDVADEVVQFQEKPAGPDEAAAGDVSPMSTQQLAALASPASDAHEPPGAKADPFAQFIVYDDETEFVYEDDEQDYAPEAAVLPLDPTKITLSRSILYLQGALLGVVALFAFIVGALFGSAGSGGGAIVDEPVTCIITGEIVLLTEDQDTIADQQAVAIVLPQGSRPETKLEILGLRPQDPPPAEDHPGLLAIRNMGGDFTRADEEGRYRLQVPDRGKYFLLVISASRKSDAELEKTESAQIGRYFQLAPDLFGGYDHRWQEEAVRSDRQLNFVF